MTEFNGYFAVHSQGLGHATRSVALARGLLRRRPDLAFLFLAGVPALDLVVTSGFDALTAPPAPDWPIEDGGIGPVWRWYADYARYLRVARRFFRRELDFDYYRFLISDSELASVREAMRSHVPTALLVNEFVRDFAKKSLSLAYERVANFWFSRLARKVDLILATDEAPDWPNVRRVGPIVRTPSASRERLREDLFFRRKTILVTAGGTAMGEVLLRKAIDAYRALDLDDASMVVVSGPKLKVDPAPGVYTYGFVPNLQDMVLASDLVITTAGKGTTGEALAFGTPVIAIPPRGHAEAERNAAALGYRPDDIDRLPEIIAAKLDEGRLAPQATGNEEAVTYLLEFLEQAGARRR
jgi:glycosyltransferase involved in cell wall biosynthesis